MSNTHLERSADVGTEPAELADVAVTPGLLLEAAADARARADRAERDLLAVAVEWAHAHPETPADTRLTILPVLDTAEILRTHPHETRYAIPEPMRRAVETLEPTCVFPWCTRPTHTCDLDHCDPYRHPDRHPGSDPGGGPTCPCNLTALCRHHHQLKTHTSWTYTTSEPGVHHWTDPHGRHYLREGPSTTAVSRAVG